MASWISSVNVWPEGCSTKVFCAAVPIQFEALRVRRHPDLPDWRVGADDELAGRLFELDGKRAGIEVGLEFGVIGSRSQPLVERLKRLVGSRFELLIVHRNGPNLDSSRKYPAGSP